MVALLISGVYLAMTLVAGLLPGLKVSQSVDGYVAADRSMNSVVLYFVLGASIFSSFAFLGGPGWAYSRGVAALYIVAYGVLGMLPLYFIGPRVRRMGIRRGFVTQAELLAHRYDSRALSVLLAVLSVAAFIPYLVIQMKGAGLILTTLSEGRVSEPLAIGVTYGVVVFYVLTSGVLGVGWTNMLQGMFMMVVAWFLGLYLPLKLYGGVGPMFAQLLEERPELLAAPGLDASGAPWTWAAFGSAVGVSAIGFTMWPHLFMKSYAAKSDRSLRQVVVLYPTFQIFLIPILFIGFSGVLAFPGVEPADSILPFLLSQLELSPILVGLVCAGTLAASMSSGDTMLHAAASIGVRDGLLRVFGGGWNDKQQTTAIRILVLVIALTAYYFAVVAEFSLVALLLAAYGGVAQIMPPVVAAFYWRRATRAGAVSGLVVGLAVNCFFLVQPGPVAGLHEGAYGLAANVLTLLVVSMATQPDPAELVEEYVTGSGDV
ncbi:MAG: sodium:solute symporter family protein [Acidobacteriota bacterium]